MHLKKKKKDTSLAWRANPPRPVKICGLDGSKIFSRPNMLTQTIIFYGSNTSIFGYGQFFGAVLFVHLVHCVHLTGYIFGYSKDHVWKVGLEESYMTGYEHDNECCYKRVILSSSWSKNFFSSICFFHHQILDYSTFRWVLHHHSKVGMHGGRRKALPPWVYQNISL